MAHVSSAHAHGDFRIALAIAGLIAAFAAFIGLASIVALFLLIGSQTGQYSEVTITTDSLIHSLPGQAGWIALIMVYSALVIGLPTFAILYLARGETNG